MIRSSDNIRAYCIGATNALFTQRQEVIDVIVSVSLILIHFKCTFNPFSPIQINDKDEGQIDILSPELKKELALTKQDLRFMDFLLKMIELNADPNGMGLFYILYSFKSFRPIHLCLVWEGGDEWIRTQFQGYLLALLATTGTEKKDPTVAEFNEEFINAWRVKHNYRWVELNFALHFLTQAILQSMVLRHSSRDGGH
jgi:hypothetical protein